MNLIKSIFRIARHLIILLLLVLIAVVISNNSNIATVSLYPLPFEIETKIFVVMISFFLIGMIFGVLSCSKSLIKNTFENFKNRQKIKKLKKKIKKD